MQVSDDSGSLPGESPYIGKCCFHKNEYAVEHRDHAKPNEAQHGSVGSSTRSVVAFHGRLDSMNIDEDVTSETVAKKQQIDLELQDKISALAEGVLWLWLSNTAYTGYSCISDVLYNPFQANRLFHQLANTYLIFVSAICARLQPSLFAIDWILSLEMCKK